MTPDVFPAARPWAEANFAAAELGDRRRTRRLVDTAEQLAQQPEGSLPAHFSWNPLRAVLRAATNRGARPSGPGLTTSTGGQDRAVGVTWRASTAIASVEGQREAMTQTAPWIRARASPTSRTW